MSYKIEINADTLTELGGKLLALASQFHAQPVGAPAIDPVMPEVRDAEDKPKRTRKAKTEEPQEVAESAPAGPTQAQQNAPDAEATESPQTTEEPASTPAAAEPAAPTPDFENDVAPVVIDAVGKIGKEAVSEVLSQFGAARASEVDPAQWGELVDALKAKL